jgi:hypothetical protein
VADPTPEEAAAAKAAEDAAAKAAADKEKADAEAAAAKKKADEEFDPERARATIAAQRASEAKLKADIKALKEKADAYDKAQAEKLSEQEKLAKEAEDAKALAATAQKQLREAKLLAELAKPEHGIVNAAAAAKLIDGVEFDDDGEPKNLTEKGADGKSLIESFLAANSFLKGQAQTPDSTVDFGGGANRGGGGASTAQLTQEELDAAKSFGMSPEEYAKYKDAQVQPEPAAS